MRVSLFPVIVISVLLGIVCWRPLRHEGTDTEDVLFISLGLASTGPFNPTLSIQLIFYKPTNIVFYEPIKFFRVKSNSSATIFLED